MSRNICWNSLVPGKVNICIWGAIDDRLPSRVKLLHRGLSLASSLCVFCDSDEEYHNHCLLTCHSTSQLWCKFWNWWRIDSPPNTVSISALMDYSPPFEVIKMWIVRRTPDEDGGEDEDVSEKRRLK
ncbi:RNA-directed DNA polymerase, eukaryota, reverse transcriptase zinc-binding domain protein [Tanacetum coccineum]